MQNLTYNQNTAAKAIGFTTALLNTTITIVPNFVVGTSILTITAMVSSNNFYSQVGSTYDYTTESINLLLGIGDIAIDGFLAIPLVAANYTISGIVVPFIIDFVHHSTHPELVTSENYDPDLHVIGETHDRIYIAVDSYDIGA